MTSTTPCIRRDVGLALLLALGAVVAHLAWLGWDHEYQVDAATGIASGPYEAWQVIGCVATLALLAAAAGLAGRPVLAVAVLPIAYAAAWSVQASQAGEPNLWPVGAVLIVAGVGVGAWLVATPVAALRGRAGKAPTHAAGRRG